MPAKKIHAAMFALSLSVMTAPAGAEEIEDPYQHGDKLHEDHCLKCHTDSVYMREDRVVKTINALGKQVRICRDNTGMPWFDSDTDAVIHFLNKKYYKF